MKKYLLVVPALIGSLLVTKQALAVCPVCTIAVGAGVGFSRSLGVDDSIAGLWIGGLTVSMIVWTISWFVKKNINFKFRSAITIIGYYLLVVVPLYFMGLMANPLEMFRGGPVDKIFLGVVVGSIGFWFGANWYEDMKEKNGGHAYFPFQKVLMPIAPLIIMTIIFYFLTK